MAIEKVALIGMGAMGILLGNQIVSHFPKDNFLVVADEARIKRYQAEGVTINDAPCSFRYVTPEHSEEVVDLAIFAVKYGALEAAIESMRPLIDEQTTIISVLNGIASEADLSRAFSPKQVLYSIAQGMDATREGTQLKYTVPGLLEIGVQEPAQAPRLEALRTFLDQVGIRYTLPKDMKHNLWSKFMLNCGVNQVVGVYGQGYGVVQREGEARNMMIDAMKEVIRVAVPEDVHLTEDDLTGYVTVIDGLSPKGKPSMLQDIEAGRPTEVELFSGTVRKLGQKHGIATPVNDALYEKLIHM